MGILFFSFPSLRVCFPHSPPRPSRPAGRKGSLDFASGRRQRNYGGRSRPGLGGKIFGRLLGQTRLRVRAPGWQLRASSETGTNVDFLKVDLDLLITNTSPAHGTRALKSPRANHSRNVSRYFRCRRARSNQSSLFRPAGRERAGGVSGGKTLRRVGEKHQSSRAKNQERTS